MQQPFDQFPVNGAPHNIDDPLPGEQRSQLQQLANPMQASPGVQQIEVPGAQAQQPEAMPSQAPSAPPVDQMWPLAGEAAMHAWNQSWDNWSRVTNELFSLHAPDLKQMTDETVDPASKWQGKPITPENQAEYEADMQAGPQKASDLKKKTAVAYQQMGERLRQRADELMGPQGQLTMLNKAMNETASHVRDVQSYVSYGMTPGEVDKLQQDSMSGDPTVRADANRQLKEAQEKALTPGDPARIWNNMGSFNQAMFLAGNAASQLGLALMHVNGPTPMDQLNHLMEMDFQKQKMQFEAKQGALRNSYDAYSFAAKRTDDLIAREAMTKNMMLEPLRLQLEAAGQVQEAQQVSNQQKALQNTIRMQKYEMETKRAMGLLQAAHMQMGLVAPMLRMQTTPVPEQARKQFNALLDSANTLSKSHGELEGSDSSFWKAVPLVASSRSEYDKSTKERAIQLAANETGSASPNAEAIKAQEDILQPNTLGSRKDALHNIARESARKLFQAYQHLDEIQRQFRPDRGEVSAFEEQLHEAIRNAAPDVKAELHKLVGGGERKSRRASQKE